MDYLYLVTRKINGVQVCCFSYTVEQVIIMTEPKILKISRSPLQLLMPAVDWAHSKFGKSKVTIVSSNKDILALENLKKSSNKETAKLLQLKKIPMHFKKPKDKYQELVMSLCAKACVEKAKELGTIRPE